MKFVYHHHNILKTKKYIFNLLLLLFYLAALEVKFQLKSLVVVSGKKQNYVFVIVIIVIGCRKAFKFYLLTFFIIFISSYWQTFDEWMNESDFTAESLQQIAKQSRSYTRAIHERI